jgi:diguanylate cyclase (GGDEF)-like protein
MEVLGQQASRSRRDRARRLTSAMQAWPVLQLRRGLIAFIAIVVIVDAAAIALAVRFTPVHPANLLVFGLLVACGVVTVEMTRRTGETASFVKDVCGVWELPIAILLPPAYALLAPIPRIAMAQWRVRKIAAHRRVFTAGAISLSYGSVYLAFHELKGTVAMSLTGSDSQRTAWILAVGACAVLQWVVNHSLVFTAVKGSDPTQTIRGTLFARENVHNDLIEGGVATLVTLGVAFTPVAIAFALPLVTLFQRSSRHAQLVNDARVDSKTGLLNAATWRRESACEVARALRTGSPLAVALIDIDYFKAVNDGYGHLAGDEALGAVGRALQLLVREYDLVGRFGGDEFALLLPQTDETGACNIANRIRAQVADLHFDAFGGPGAEPIRLTVSIGVAALSGAGVGDHLTELLAAADVALYRAKGAGRDQVCMATDTSSFSAIVGEVLRQA